MDVSLIYLSDLKHSGVVSATAHMYNSFKVMGHNPSIYKLRKRTEHRQRMIRGVPYRNLCYDDMMDIAYSTPSIITCIHIIDDAYREAANDLVLDGTGLLIEGTIELSRGNAGTEMLKRFADEGVMLAVIRPPLQEYAWKVHRLDSCVIPAPYVRSNPVRDEHYHAASFTTFWIRNNPEILFEANYLLPESKRIEIWGNFFGNPFWFLNGLPDHLKEVWDLKTKTAPYYNGPLSTSGTVQAAKIASMSGFCMNLKKFLSIDGIIDGGNLEYVTMETMDGMAVPVVNRGWMNRADDELVEDVNCLAVEDAKELVDLLTDYSRDDFLDIVSAGEEALEKHLPEHTVSLLLEYMGGTK